MVIGVDNAYGMRIKPRKKDTAKSVQINFYEVPE